MNQQTLDTLIALTEANGGRIETPVRGMTAITLEADLTPVVHYADGRHTEAAKADAQDLDEAIYHWRTLHPTLFQLILGAMM